MTVNGCNGVKTMIMNGCNGVTTMTMNGCNGVKYENGHCIPPPLAGASSRCFEFLEEFLAVLHILGVEPSFLVVWIAFPLYQVLAFPAVFSMGQYRLDFEFLVLVFEL